MDFGWEGEVRPVQRIVETIPNKLEGSGVMQMGSAVNALKWVADRLLVGLQSGATLIVDPFQNKQVYSLNGSDGTPVTGVAVCAGGPLQNTAVITHSGGALQLWHWSSGKVLLRREHFKMLLCCDVDSQSSRYAVGVEDGRVLVASADRGIPQEMEAGKVGAHQNRVFCVKWIGDMLLSGGWDRTVYCWDLRCRSAVHSFFGSLVSSTAIDGNDAQLLIGSNTPESPLRLYDRRADRFQSLPWPLTRQLPLKRTTGVLACALLRSSPPTNQQIYCVTPHNQIRVYSKGVCWSQTVFELQSQIYSMDLQIRPVIATGWKNGSILVSKRIEESTI